MKTKTADVRYSALKHRVFISLGLNILILLSAFLNASYLINDVSGFYSFIAGILLTQSILLSAVSFHYQYRFLIIWSALINLTALFYLFLFAESDRSEFISFFIIYPLWVFFLGRFRPGIFLSAAGFLGLLTVYIFQLPFQEDFHYGSSQQVILISYAAVTLISFYYEKDYAKNDRRLLQEADIDFLTEIPNRRGLHKLIQPLFKSGQFSFIVIDVDDFKKINDAHGHEGGDLLLKEMSKAIGDTIRKSDIFARWGGEEFVLALPDTKKENGALLAEKIKKLLNESEFSKMKVTASFGVTSYIKNESFEELFKRADQGAYLAKTSGKNCVKIL